MNEFAAPAIRLQQITSRVTGLELDDPSAALQFTQRLQREQFSWTEAYTERVVFEYRRFLILAALSDFEITPSEAVDQAWHLHIVYTRSYHEWCDALFGAYLHHGPTKGGKEEGDRYEAQYNATLSLYESVFGSAPPEDIWPPARIRFSAKERIACVPTAKYWMLSKGLVVQLGMACAVLLGLAVATFFTVRYGPSFFETTYAQSTDEANGNHGHHDKSSLSRAEVALVLFFATVIAVGMLVFVVQAAAGRLKKSDGTGSGCGSWFGCGGGGCSSGCGGGGCGGCGGCGG